MQPSGHQSQAWPGQLLGHKGPAVGVRQMHHVVVRRFYQCQTAYPNITIANCMQVSTVNFSCLYRESIEI